MQNPRSLALLLFAALSTACASSTGKSASRVAPNNQTITIDRQAVLGISKAQLWFVRNTSSVPIVVYQISILDCANLKQYCGVNARNILIEPGQRQEIIRIEPAEETRAFNYRLQWRWRGAPRSGLTAAVSPTAGDSTATRRAAMMATIERIRQDDAKYGDKNLPANMLSALGDNFASMRAEPDTVYVAQGSRLYIYEQLRVLAVDKAGKVIGRVRAPMQWSVGSRAAIRFLSPDTLSADAVGSTTVTMRLNPQALLDTLRARTMPPVVFTIISK